MAAPYDPSVPWPTPPNYAQMLAAAADMSKTLYGEASGLGDAYQSGKNFQYEQRQRDLFQNPDNRDLLDSAISSGDYRQLLTKLIQSGGASSAQGLMPSLFAAQGQNVVNGAFGGGPPKAPNVGPGTSPAAAGPANITGQTQPTQTAATNGGDTVNSLAGDRGIDLDHFLAKNPVVRSYLNRDLSPAEAQNIGKRMDAFKGIAPSPNPVPQAGLAGDDNNTNQGTPVGTGGGAPISPAPTSASGNIGGAPATFDERATPDYLRRKPLELTVGPSKAQDRVAQNGAPPQTPSGPPSPDEIERYETRGTNKLKAAGSMYVNKEQATALRDAGNKDLEIAKQLREQRAKWFEPTPEQKNVGTGPGGPPADVLKHEIESGQKEFDSINELGDNARQSSQKLRLAQSYVNSDEYYSGPLETLNRKAKQWAATFGGDPNAGTPQEAMVKSINDLLAEQVRAMAKSGVGRVLMTEVQTMRDSIASQKITPATNRLLLEEVGRVHKAQMEIQDAANLYVKQHGHIDSGFRQLVTQYYRDHPMFTDAEIQDPRLIAPPVAPAGMDATAAKQWAKSRGLASGDPVRTQDGRIVAAP